MTEHVIAFGIEQNYIKHLSTTVISLLENNQDCAFIIYIISGGIQEEKFNSLIDLTSRYNCKLINAEIDDQCVESLVLNGYLKKAAYYRLMIPQVVKEDIVLYLDSDIVVTGSIKEIFQTDISDFYLGAILDIAYKGDPGLSMSRDAKYFNSGVMLVNVKRWKQEDLATKVIQYIKDTPQYIQFADQCGLNACVNGQWKALPLKYNQQKTMFADSSFWAQSDFELSELKEAIESPAIIHYAGRSKPWSLDSEHPLAYEYWKYLKMTPFYYTVLLSKYLNFSFRAFIIWIMPNSLLKRIRKLKHKIKKLLG